MNKAFRPFLCVFSFVCLASAAPAGPPLPAPPAAFDPAAVNQYIAAAVRAGDMVGLSVAIAREGVVQLAGAYGKSSLATGAPVTTNTLFAVGSVTKQFTAACVLLLAQEGALAVNTNVARFYPNLTRARDISLLDLMSHVSGYADYYPLDFVDSRMEAPIAADDLIAQYAGGKLDFEPGTQWSYSNTGYVILGRVVEKAGGEPLGEFMTRRILRPLGMAHSVFGPAVAGQDFAQGYTRFALGPLTPAPTEARGWLEGAAGLSTTALDLVKWDMALIQGRVLNAQSYALMTTPRQMSTGRAREYGCGIGVAISNDTIVLRHEGQISGFTAWNIIVPATQSALVILSNCEEWDAVDALKDVLAGFIMPGPPWIPRIEGPDAGAVVTEFFRALQAGRVDRGRLGAEFSRYLSPEKVRGAAARLKRFRAPVRAEVSKRSERGGMEVAEVRLVCKKGVLSALLYRTPDGRIQECLFQPGD
jgi:CubicO group peptidase (beta-lactamase class C family)